MANHARSGQKDPPGCAPATPVRRQRTVLHVITPSRMAGAETLLSRLVRHQQQRGFSVHTVINSNSPALAALRVVLPAATALAIGGKLNVLAPWRLRQKARGCGSHLLHSHLSTASWWCGWLTRCGGPPSLGHVHGFTSALWHRHQSHLLACSQAVKAHLMAQGMPGERVSVLLNPVELGDVAARRAAHVVRAELGAESRTPVVGCFAHFSEKKGWRDLIAAASPVLTRFPTAQFWCAGDGPLRPEIEREVVARGLAQQFRFLGFRDDPGDLMNAIDVLALPSYREPFGLVYVEAALHAKPVIGCRSGGTPEVIDHGKSGLLVPPRDPQALATALVSLLENPERASEMGREGRRLARQRFTWCRYLAALEGIYRRLGA